MWKDLNCARSGPFLDYSDYSFFRCCCSHCLSLDAKFCGPGGHRRANFLFRFLTFSLRRTFHVHGCGFAFGTTNFGPLHPQTSTKTSETLFRTLAWQPWGFQKSAFRFAMGTLCLLLLGAPGAATSNPTHVLEDQVLSGPIASASWL